MESSGATPISLTAESCADSESRCHIATPAPSTPFPYSPLSPYGPINPYSFMSRYSTSGAAHLQSPFSSPLASSLAAAGLAYPTDFFHYNPYSALTPTSPLTPSSFWSLTAQQSYHQLNGITFGPSGPVSYNSNAHLFNLFSPNSLSPMSPSPDLHSPSLYPRVSSLPSPYASSPGLSSAFMSPSSMPLLLSPSLSSSVDRPPTYLSDTASTPSTTPSMTPSIKCEPIEHNCGSQHTSQTLCANFNDNSLDKSDSNDRHSDKVSKSGDQKTKRHHNINNNSRHLLKESEPEAKQHHRITTTITTSTPTKTREKNSVRVGPLVRNEAIECQTDANVNGTDNNLAFDLTDKRTDNNQHKHKRLCETSIERSSDLTANEESRDKTTVSVTNKDNKEVKSVNPRVKRELIECDMSLPSDSVKAVNSVKAVPNCDEDSNDIIARETADTSPPLVSHSRDESNLSDKNLVIDDNSNSNSNSNDNKLTIVCNNVDINGEHRNPNSKAMCDTKKAKDAKRESQLKQLQSYRKESHRAKANKPSVNAVQSQPVNGSTEPKAAISIVLPKPKDQVNGEHKQPLSGKLADESQHSGADQSLHPSLANDFPPNTVLSSTNTKAKPIPGPVAVPSVEAITCCTKPVAKVATNTAINPNANPLLQQKQSVNGDKTQINGGNNQTNGHKLSPNNATKQLPKKPRISRKPTSAGIPVGIAIAQQRTSPKNKSPNDSSVNSSQPLKPILPTLSLPMMTNSPILITDSPPAGTSLWIKPTTNSTVTTQSMQTNSQFSLSGDYQLARDSLTGHLYLIRNSSSLPSTPTATTPAHPKPPTLIPPLNIKGDQSKSSPSAIITLPVGTAQPQQFFASMGQTQGSTLILDTTSSTPLVQIAATHVGHNLTNGQNGLGVKCVHPSDHKTSVSARPADSEPSSVNMERGCQASISDDELTCDNMKTTATQVDMDAIHSSEEDDDNEAKCHKLRLFNERKGKTSERSVNDNEDEDSRDSLQLQIVDESGEEPPQLPVKSAPVMQFIDHHGLDLLVDSIEEFAARETSPVPSDAVNGLQLLSTLAEQRSLEERSASDAGALRRHSADSSIDNNGLNANNQTNADLSPAKRKQRSESCFTTNPMRYLEESEALFSDIKKLMKTSGSQTDDRRAHICDASLVSLRRSERIFINDSVVTNGSNNALVGTKVATKESIINSNGEVTANDKDMPIAKDVKRKEIFAKCSVIPAETKSTSDQSLTTGDQSVAAKPKDQYVFTDTKCDEMVSNLNTFSVISNKYKISGNFVFCDKSKSNNQKIVSDSTKDSVINGGKSSELKKKKKRKLLENDMNGQKDSDGQKIAMKSKKRKKRVVDGVDNNKKLKSDYDKQIDDSIDTIIKRVSQIDESIDGSLCEQLSDKVHKTGPEKSEKKTSDEKANKLDDSKTNDELKEKKRKRDKDKDKPKHKEKEKEKEKDEEQEKDKEAIRQSQSLGLYDQKRMRLLDQTIDEIIARHSVVSPEPSPDQKQLGETVRVEQEEPKSQTTEEQAVVSDETPVAKPSKGEEEPLKVETPKAKPLVKQPSTTSSVCSSSSSSIFSVSASESCQSSAAVLNLRLSESDLDLKLNVIMLVDGLLFVGEICPIQPPDIYGITLHGERQHRPIIYSQEEMLKEAIREVKPSLEDLEEGQRVCAYWSTQYRHLYPGYVRSSSPHPNLVFVEFDDGDNGRIAIDDIRLLPQDYPQMKINADPLKNLERRRRMSSCGKDNRKDSAKHSESIGDTKGDDKKTSTNETTKVFKNSVGDESKSNSAKESNKRDKDLKSKSNKSCNTVSDKTTTNHDSFGDKSNIKSEAKKKKRKHNKEDRHHRHHHNHKHHHCRHHRKCKKHKKPKEDASGDVSATAAIDECSGKSDRKNDKMTEINVKGTKTTATKAPKEGKLQNNQTDAQNVSVNKQTDDKSAVSNQETLKDSPKKPRLGVKKTPEQRALDRLQSNLNEAFLTISSPIRAVKRLNADTSSAPTPKKRERMPSAEKSKIAAFLPDRQLWHWSGTCIRRTGSKSSRTRKCYYKEIERGRERIRVDDCAVFLSTGRPHLPYIGRIDSMWQTGSGTMIVKVRWFYHPEETKGQPVPLQDKRGALFESSHFDVNDVQTISHKCQVISWTEYQEKRRDNPLMASDDLDLAPPNVYYLAGKYDALAGHVQMDPDVPLRERSVAAAVTTDKSNTDNNKDKQQTEHNC